MGMLKSIARRFGSRPGSRPVAQPDEPAAPVIKFADLAEYLPDDVIPWLDRAQVDETGLTPEQLSWRRDGVVRLDKFIPDEVTQPYIERRAAHWRNSGWLYAAPYMDIREMRDLALYPPLMEVMRSLIGEEMMLHLCLTGWMSSQRGWHQDDYLNPDFVNTWYAAVWIALGDIHPDSGPFEYVPGSHRWPLMRGENVRRFLTEEELTRTEEDSGRNHWERYAERFVNPAIDAEIQGQDKEIVPFLAQKGDVLIWHGRLMHRGAMPKVYGMERRSLIAHYSGVNHRPDMAARAVDQNGQNYAVFDTTGLE
jgi:hypothetical protein